MRVLGIAGPGLVRPVRHGSRRATTFAAGAAAAGNTAAMATDEERRPEAHLPAERRFGWSNMFVAPEEDPCNQVPSVGERATLVDFCTAIATSSS